MRGATRQRPRSITQPCRASCRPDHAEAHILGEGPQTFLGSAAASPVVNTYSLACRPSPAAALPRVHRASPTAHSSPESGAEHAVATPWGCRLLLQPGQETPHITNAQRLQALCTDPRQRWYSLTPPRTRRTCSASDAIRRRSPSRTATTSDSPNASRLTLSQRNDLRLSVTPGRRSTKRAASSCPPFPPR